MTVKLDHTRYHIDTRIGHPRLVQVLSELYTPLLGCSVDHLAGISPELAANTFASLNRSIEPMSEILVSLGAYGSLSAVMHAFLDQDDEVLIIEPAFDCYVPQAKMAGAKPESKGTDCPSSGDWKLDFEEMEAKITPKCKMIVLNSPNNPLGKVFTMEELKNLANICIRHNLLCVSDEVYEWLVYPPNKHIKIASLPGMWARTLTIGSAGKTFSVTGWKLGWTVGPKNLIEAMQLHQQNTIYTCPTPLQVAHLLFLNIFIKYESFAFFVKQTFGLLKMNHEKTFFCCSSV
ncbi:unnamed protein product [Protopolystoma xenopodis]|uniref:Aminotransferase class I/classII large domain-containing protein n=1 Tax=Protopolystoma xenopodis TaxID=117903 RepID=A0A448XGW7_9PLAT|nr:unnamed protein product [Protopolystoma xenopodis]